MNYMKNKFLFTSPLFVMLLFLLRVTYAQEVPSPKEHFGFHIGDDYQLATFTQTEAYFRKLDESSDRAQLVTIGKTEEGRDQFMLVVSSPENLRNLKRYQEISQKMARAEIEEEEAKALALEGKAVVWIDGGLHATETVGTHQLIETAYQLTSRQDAETKEILDHVIILLVHANPDGQELVSNWYMRESVPEKRSMSRLPRLYHKYIGHDNNRDFFMFNMKESQNMGRQLFVDWIPQIVYNHHQSGPAGTVVVGPPYRDPFNYVYDPILMTSLDALGAAMHNRLNVEGKAGYAQRGGSVFSTWWNGGLRTSVYFHNMIGILTEITGSPTPTTIPLVPGRLLPNGDSPNPVLPQKWHFRQSIDYSISLNYAVLHYAARHTDDLLFNSYRMGRNSVERGSTDTWSLSPKKVEQLQNAYQDAPRKPTVGTAVNYVDSVFKSNENQDPYGYILPSDQSDFPNAIRFLNALIRGGVVVHQAEEAFTVQGVNYPKGSYVVKTAQAFRPQVLDMFEPQDHPNDFKYEGGPPVAPYDAAGWTLAYLMNVKFDRILTDFTGPFSKREPGDLISFPSVMVEKAKNYRLARANNSYQVVNDLLKAGIDVYRETENGDFCVAGTPKATQILQETASETGVKVSEINRLPEGSVKIKPARIALWDRYGGSMPSGWIRWLLEQYDYPFTVVYPPDIDAGNLRDQYDVIILVGGAIPASGGSSGNRVEDGIPEAYRAQLGNMSVQKSVPQLQKFLEKGGRVVTIGSSARLARHLHVPVKDALTETIDGQEKPLTKEKFYIPGSVLRVKVANNLPATWGMEAYADIYFSQSPVFKMKMDAISGGSVEPLMWFDSPKPLRSGWAWGQSYLQDGIAAYKARIGQGELFVFGPEITFRAQTQGTFRLLFNQLYAY